MRNFIFIGILCLCVFGCGYESELTKLYSAGPPIFPSICIKKIERIGDTLLYRTHKGNIILSNKTLILYFEETKIYKLNLQFTILPDDDLIVYYYHHKPQNFVIRTSSTNWYLAINTDEKVITDGLTKERLFRQ